MIDSEPGSQWFAIVVTVIVRDWVPLLLVAAEAGMLIAKSVQKISANAITDVKILLVFVILLV